MTNHQKAQKAVIEKLESQIDSQTLQASHVTPVEDYENDPRICLTGVHIPGSNLIREIQQSLITPLHEVEPSYYYYPPDAMHMTIKNVRIINDPPNFGATEIEKAHQVFSEIIPNHKTFNVYFYRLLLFPNNLALIGTTDPGLDDIIFDIGRGLEKAGIPDDKVYANSRHFFCYTTLARFNGQPSEEFRQKIKELSNNISLPPYTVDSVSLVSCNAVFKKLQIHGKWNLAAY